MARQTPVVRGDGSLPVLAPAAQPSAVFTPGPWGTERDPCHWDSLTTVVGPGSARVAEATGNTLGECEANARLIAAAPDLLEALSAIVKPNGYDVGGKNGMNLERARDAIRKALGPSAQDTTEQSSRSGRTPK